MITELGSVYSKLLIDNLLNVHALTNMYRASNNEEYRRAAADWLPALENQLSILKRELLAEKVTEDRNAFVATTLADTP